MKASETKYTLQPAILALSVAMAGAANAQEDQETTLEETIVRGSYLQ